MSFHSSGFKPTYFNRRQFLQHTAVTTSGLWALTAAPGLLAQDPRGATRSGTVQTTSGKVQGLRYYGDVEAFYGIPFAASTAGPARFKAPEKPVPWNGVRDAIRVGNRSPQTLGGPISEVAALDRREPLGEDCLNLNVFTPGTNSGDRPVMVWLHGGGYTSGSGGWLLYDGTNLARSEDVVVVTINHRLNAFGYLHLAGLGGEQYSDSGNAGMLDIIAALEWVRDNIADFGGNPDNVTIFGQSGGGGKVSTLLAMPGAKGLFHKAIAMSGSNIHGIPAEQATETAERYLASLGLSADQLDELHTLPMQTLLSAYVEAPRMQLGPVVDGKHLPSAPFAPQAPAISAHIPLMMGSTEHEINFIPSTPLEPVDEVTLLQMVGESIRASEGEAQRLLDLYRAGRPDASNIELYQIILSDLAFKRGVMTQTELKSEQEETPVYLYYFRWNSPVREGKLRAYHCLDIPFAFNNVDESSSMTGAIQERYPLATRMSGAFAAFARTGDPNHPDLPTWPAFNTSSRATMIVDDELMVVNDPFGEETRALYAMTP